MAFLLPLLPILAQIGPFTQPGAPTGPNVPHVEGRDQPRHKPAPPPAQLPPPVTGKGQACRDALETNPSEAVENAEEWVAAAKGIELAQAKGCLGMAHGRRGEWADAETAFLAARDASGEDRAARASFGAMAGNAALAGNQPDRALATLTRAQEDADSLADKASSAEIALDRARALVALKRPGEARTAIDLALSDLPSDSDAWLLSATLYRRAGKLDMAQQQIEKAAAINPVDPAIGLEAGVIAVLGGREAAARKSWQSVLAAAPGSPEASQAKSYLDQIGPAVAPASVKP